MSYNEPETNEEYEACDDARTLARAEEIRGDKQRVSRAREAAKALAEKELEEATAMKKIAAEAWPMDYSEQGRKTA